MSLSHLISPLPCLPTKPCWRYGPSQLYYFISLACYSSSVRGFHLNDSTEELITHSLRLLMAAHSGNMLKVDHNSFTVAELPYVGLVWLSVDLGVHVCYSLSHCHWAMIDWLEGPHRELLRPCVLLFNPPNTVHCNSSANVPSFSLNKSTLNVNGSSQFNPH
jgi:hypothetical protein